MVQIKLWGRTRCLSDLSVDVCFPQVLSVSKAASLGRALMLCLLSFKKV